MSLSKHCPQCGRDYEDTQKFCPEDGATLRSRKADGDLVGHIVADRYHIIRKLGEGGMGQVYLAEHVRMKRKSAVKVMSPGMMNDPDAISRFNREASNASQISHSNVAAIYDFGETTDGLIYLAMEFVDGEPLSRLIERHDALPALRAASITQQTADALGAAHDLGIVHRDLKPDNIMIAKNRDGSDCVKVVDFGIAKASRGGDGQKVTRTGFVVGTPEYMSPEQLSGDTVDGRSDIYSLGLVAFNMFTGKLPFPSKTSQEAMIMRLTDRPRTLLEMKEDVPWPAELQAVMDKALARDSAIRYSDSREFGRDLIVALQGMPNLTAEQLGTQIVTAKALAASLPKSSGVSRVSVPKMTPTIAAAVLSSGVRPSAATVTTGARQAPAPANPATPPPIAIPAERSEPAPRSRGGLYAIAAVVVLALAGGGYAMTRGGSTAEAGNPGSDAVATPGGPAVEPAPVEPTPSGASASASQSDAKPASPSVTPATTAPAATAITATIRVPRTLPANARVTVGGRPVTGRATVLAGPVELSLLLPGRPAYDRSLRVKSGETIEWPTRQVIADATAQPRLVSAAPVQAAPAPAVSPPVAETRTALPPPPAPVERRPEPVTPPTTAPASPGYDRSAATQEIAGIVGRFAAAFQTRRIEAVRAVFPGMTLNAAQRWESLLTEKALSELSANASLSQAPDFSGDEADIAFTMKMDYRIGGTRQSPTFQYTGKLRRDNSRWRMIEVKAAS